MPEFLNNQTGQMENVPHDEATQKFISGQLALPKGKAVPMIAGNGSVALVDPEHVFDSITKGGYTFASPEQTHAFEMEQKYSNEPLGELKTFAQGAVESIPFLGGPILKAGAKTGLGPSEEALEERPKYNPISHGAGVVTGTIAQVLAPEVKALEGANAIVNPLKGATKLGTAAEELAATKLASKGAQGLAKNIINAGVAKGIGGAVEGAAFGLGQTVNEAFLGDPSLAAQNLASNVGIAALIGGSIAAPIGMLGKGISEAVSKVKPSSSATDEALQITNELRTVSGKEPLEKGPVDYLLKDLTGKKPNAAAIEGAAKELGVPSFAGQVSDSGIVQKMQSALWQWPTLASKEARAVLESSKAKVASIVEGLLPATENLTENEVGKVVRDGLIKAVEDESAPINKLYETITKDGATIPVNQTSLKRVGNNILKLDGLHLSPSSPEAQLARSVVDELENIKTVEDIRKYKSILGRRTYGQPQIKYVAGVIREKLANLEESAILNHAKNMVVPGEEAELAVKDLITRHNEAKVKYKALMEKLGEVGDVIGKRKIHGVGDFIDHLKDTQPEALARRLFARNNADFLTFFKKEFPAEFNVIANHEKGKLLAMASKADGFRPLSVVREVNKLSKEAQNLLFTPEQLTKLKAAETYLGSLPEKALGPSGTPEGMAYLHWVTSPKTALGMEVGSKAISKTLDTLHSSEQSAVHVLAKVDRMVRKTSAEIGNGVNAIIKGAPFVANAVRKLDHKSPQEEREQYKKRIEQISTIASNPTNLLDLITKETENLYPVAPKITQSFQSTAINATSFLASKVPRHPDRKPLSQEWIPSRVEISKFNKYYDAVNNPVSVLSHIQAGTLTNESVEAVKTVYPDLYSHMVSQIFTKITELKEPLPYKTRLMLSLFVGQDLDGSTSPKVIQLNQQSLQSPSLQKDNQPIQAPLSIAGRTQTNLGQLANKQ